MNNGIQLKKCNKQTGEPLDNVFPITHASLVKTGDQKTVEEKIDIINNVELPNIKNNLKKLDINVEDINQSIENINSLLNNISFDYNDLINKPVFLFNLNEKILELKLNNEIVTSINLESLNNSSSIVPVKSVTLNKSNYAFKTNETFQLIETVLPSNASDKSVVWNCNNSNATVVNGLVTAKSAGDCIVTCTTTDGGKIASCNFTINEQIVYGNIVTSQNSISVNENETTEIKIKLDKQPSQSQNVNLLINNEYCTLDKNTLMFTPSNYNIEQTIIITGVHNNNDYTNKDSIITLSSSNVNNKTINVSVLNIDTNVTDQNQEYVKENLICHLVPNGTQNETIWQDMSGNNNNGQLIGFDFVNNGWQNDGSLKFNDLSHVKFPDKFFLNNYRFTIEVTAVVNNSNGLQTLITNEDNKPRGVWFAIDTRTSTTEPKLRCSYGTGITNEPTSKIILGKKQVYTCTIGVGNGIKTFIDGELINSTGVNWETTQQIPLYLGYSPARENKFPLDGTIYSVKIYSDILTDEQILKNANYALSGNVPAKTEVTSITIPSNETIPINQRKAIYVDIQPENATDTIVEYSSNNPNIIVSKTDLNEYTDNKFRSAIIYARKSGSAIVTARHKSGHTSTCNVDTIVKEIPIDKILINQKTINAYVGYNYRLTANILPYYASNKTIMWTSSDPSKVDISNRGIITTKAPGEVTITATASNGKKDTCIMNITELSTNDIYNIDLSQYSISNDGTNAIETTKGINNAITFAKNNNKKCCKLPAGTYLIDENSTVSIPDNMMLDLGTSTLKIKANGLETYTIVTLSGINSHIINGIVEGDKDVHDYGSIGNKGHEFGFGIRAMKFVNSIIDNVTIKNCTGYAISIDKGDNALTSEAVNRIRVQDVEYGGINAQGIMDGLDYSDTKLNKTWRLKENRDISHTDIIQLGFNFGMGQMGYISTYVNMDFFFYNADGELIDIYTGCVPYFKYVKPLNAKFINIMFKDSWLPNTGYEDFDNSFLFFTNMQSENGTVSNCICEYNRCLGLATSGQYSLFYKNIFRNNGGAHMNGDVDFEDGGDYMVNNYFINNQCLSGTLNGLVLCSGRDYYVCDNTFDCGVGADNWRLLSYYFDNNTHSGTYMQHNFGYKNNDFIVKNSSFTGKSVVSINPGNEDIFCNIDIENCTFDSTVTKKFNDLLNKNATRTII